MGEEQNKTVFADTSTLNDNKEKPIYQVRRYEPSPRF